MRTITRVLVATVAAGLLTVGFAPAAHASDPTDCTLTAAGTDGLKMTCTARPPTQTWHLMLFCTYWVKPVISAGNRVTGNGTSEAHCAAGVEPDGGFFALN